MSLTLLFKNLALESPDVEAPAEEAENVSRGMVAEDIVRGIAAEEVDPDG